MKKEVQYSIYSAIIILVVAGFFYNNFQLEELENNLLQQQQTIKSALEEEIKTLNQEIEQLEKEDASLQKNVEQLDTSLKEKGAEIEELGGELDEVKEDSEQLEQSISTLKVGFQDFSEIIENTVDSVVSVQTNLGSGSGFFYQDGFIVTNYHVIEGATNANIVTHDGARHTVRLIGHSFNADIAVLEINDTSYDRIRLADSDGVKVGEKAIAIGNPGGLDFTVTQGIVSAIRMDDGNEYVQIDAPINPGNSGGPLINANGRVIGVNTLKIAGFEGVGFALSSNQVENVVDEILG